MRAMIKKTAAAIAVSAFVSSAAFAVNQSVTADVSFITPLSISNVTNANFGFLSAGADATTYVLDTLGVVTVSSGTGSQIGGTPAAGSFDIVGSASQTINISTSGYTANGGVTPSAATCKYGAAAAVSCDAVALDTAAAPGGGAGTNLKLGLTIAADANRTEGAVTPSFTVSVVYN